MPRPRLPYAAAVAAEVADIGRMYQQYDLVRVHRAAASHARGRPPQEDRTIYFTTAPAAVPEPAGAFVAKFVPLLDAEAMAAADMPLVLEPLRSDAAVGASPLSYPRPPGIPGAAAGVGGGGSGGGDSTGGPLWKCTACTLENVAGAAVCAACGATAPVPGGGGGSASGRSGASTLATPGAGEFSLVCGDRECGQAMSAPMGTKKVRVCVCVCM